MNENLKREILYIAQADIILILTANPYISQNLKTEIQMWVCWIDNIWLQPTLQVDVTKMLFILSAKPNNNSSILFELFLRILKFSS